MGTEGSLEKTSQVKREEKRRKKGCVAAGGLFDGVIAGADILPASGTTSEGEGTPTKASQQALVEQKPPPPPREGSDIMQSGLTEFDDMHHYAIGARLS